MVSYQIYLSRSFSQNPSRKWMPYSKEKMKRALQKGEIQMRKSGKRWILAELGQRTASRKYNL